MHQNIEKHHKERHRTRQGRGEQIQREVREVRVIAASSLQKRGCHELIAEYPSDGSGGWKEVSESGASQI